VMKQISNPGTLPSVGIFPALIFNGWALTLRGHYRYLSLATNESDSQLTL
jgi:hypothetical protein